MSDPISVSLEIGGIISASLVDQLLACINYDIDRGDGPLTRIEMEGRNDSLTVYGMADYGLCNKTHNFCIEHQIPFIIHAEASGECNADTTFFVPGMEDSENYMTDQNETAVVRSSQVRPMFDLLIALVEGDLKALPKFMNNPAVRDLVKDCLESPDDIISHLKERIDEILPREAPDNVPPLIIDKSK